MRSVIGGAYNGKRNFVEQWLRQIEAQQIHIFEGEIPPSDFTKDEYVVIGNFEKIVMNYPELQEDEIAVFPLQRDFHYRQWDDPPDRSARNGGRCEYPKTHSGTIGVL